MATPVIGDVVVVPFPFSDLSGSRRRPAAVLAIAEHGDIILCQITSRRWSSLRAIRILDEDFATGNLERVSYARPNKLFTASADIAIRTVGRLTDATTTRLREATRELFG